MILLGHSAGGTLALYASCKLDKLSNDVSIALCVAVAPIGAHHLQYTFCYVSRRFFTNLFCFSHRISSKIVLENVRSTIISKNNYAHIKFLGNLCEGYERKLSDDGDAIPLYMGCSPITVPSAAIGSTISPSTAEDSICPYMYVL